MQVVVFLSLFLGLVTGRQSVSLQVDPAVASAGIELNGRELVRIDRAPWSATVDFGSALSPGELTAVAYASDGREISRTTQFINVSRPAAEMEIIIRSKGERPFEAELVGRHRLHSHPTHASLSIDGAPVHVGRDFRAVLPAVDWTRPHVASAEMHFDDGEVARRDLAIEAGFSGSVGSELAPLLVTMNTQQETASLEGCFSAEGKPLRASAIEKSDALLIMVRDPDFRTHLVSTRELPIAFGTTERLVWPVSRAFNTAGEATAIAFPQSVNHGKLPTVGWLLTERLVRAPVTFEPRQFADAVAVAAIGSLERGRRRAVVLLLSKETDRSLYAPSVVRSYLREIGVPLFVWSADGSARNPGGGWGPVEDISTPAGVVGAVARLNDALARQRVVWVAADPLTALRAEGTERCGLSPVAHRSAGRMSP